MTIESKFCRNSNILDHSIYFNVLDVEIVIQLRVNTPIKFFSESKVYPTKKYRRPRV